LNSRQLNGRAGLEYGDRFGGTIYNGNADVTVTQLRIKVTTKIDRQDVSRIYVDDVIIPPHSAKAFGFDIVVGDKGAEYSWDTDGARGH
jgi:hypothetical protein